MQIHRSIKDGFNYYKLIYSEYRSRIAATVALNFAGKVMSDHCEQDHSNNL